MTKEEAIEYLNSRKKIAQECAEDFERSFPQHKSAWRRDVEVYDMAISALRAQQEAEKNEPLTLDELREMDGEPVYIVFPGYEKYCPGHWETLERAGKWGWNGNHGEYFESNYESMWLAYRRKPEEGAK